MKIFILLFAVYTLALSLAPCSDMHAGQIDIPLTIQSAHEHHQDPIDLCTPFCQCSCCQGFVIITPFKHSSQGMFSSKEQFSFYIDRLPFEIANDHWQPPRIG